MARTFWTFPVPDSDCLVVVSSDREGLLLLNPTAAWIYEHQHLPDLSPAYADYFGVSLAQADSDIRDTIASFHDTSTTFDLQIEQATFQIRFETSSLADELLPRLDALQIPPPAVAGHTFLLAESTTGATIYKDGVLFAVEPLITGARAILLQELTRLAIPDRTFTAILHAGAVGTSDACLILAGASFAGKSTLCEALMQTGLLCYSDDSACLTPDFEIAGMPFALAMRHGERFRPSNLNGTSPTAPAKALIFVNYQPTASTTTLEPISTFDALVAFEQSGFWIEHTQPATAAFLNWLSKLPIHRLTYSDLASAVAIARELL